MRVVGRQPVEPEDEADLNDGEQYEPCGDHEHLMLIQEGCDDGVRIVRSVGQYEGDQQSTQDFVLAEEVLHG